MLLLYLSVYIRNEKKIPSLSVHMQKMHKIQSIPVTQIEGYSFGWGKPHDEAINRKDAARHRAVTRGCCAISSREHHSSRSSCTSNFRAPIIVSHSGRIEGGISQSHQEYPRLSFLGTVRFSKMWIDLSVLPYILFSSLTLSV